MPNKPRLDFFDADLAERTTATPVQIAYLVDLVLQSTYFHYNGSIYEQRYGTAMGSLVSTFIAYFYMEIFEEQAIESAPCLRSGRAK